MYGNFTFESTQSRGDRIMKTLGDIGWGEMPEDGLLLKEYETPMIRKDDTPPPQKPYIKNTLRQFWDEPAEEEKTGPNLMINHMEIERPIQEEETPETEDPNSRGESNKATPIAAQPKGVQPHSSQFYTERKLRILKKQEDAGPTSVMHTQGTQYTQHDGTYMKKLADALNTNKFGKGKTKYSQKFNKASSTTLFERKLKQGDMASQMTNRRGDINEDIEDLEEVQEEGVYASHFGQKKLKLEVEVDNPNRQQVMQTIERYISLSNKKFKKLARHNGPSSHSAWR